MTLPRDIFRRAAPILGAALMLGAGSAWCGGQPQPEPKTDSPPKEAPAPAAPTTTPSAPAAPAARPHEQPESDFKPEAEITLKDGRKVSGLLISQDNDAVVISINTIATTFPRETIDHVRVLASVEDRYKALRAAIDDRNLDGLLQLVEWLRTRERYDLAMKEIDFILAADPLNVEAKSIKTLLAQQIELKKKGKKVEPGKPVAPQGAVKAPAAPEFPLLTEEQMNLIRVYEIDLNDPPRITIQRDTMSRFLEKFAGEEGIPTTREGREAFYRRPAAEVMGVMFKHRARDFYGEIKIHDNPESLKKFRDSVHRVWLINSCATTACHGGEEAGRLYLASKKTAMDQTVYTNFFILDKFRTKDGQPLIDYSEPARSPLLQMALPRDGSLFKHPEVDVGPTHAKWKPVFKNVDDPKFVDAAAWIASMYRPRPEYPIDYVPPVPKSAKPVEPQPR